MQIPDILLVRIEEFSRKYIDVWIIIDEIYKFLETEDKKALADEFELLAYMIKNYCEKGRMEKKDCDLLMYWIEQIYHLFRGDVLTVEAKAKLKVLLSELITRLMVKYAIINFLQKYGKVIQDVYCGLH